MNVLCESTCRTEPKLLVGVLSVERRDGVTKPLDLPVPNRVDNIAL